jgi:dTDP-4-dehydrorhamnose reductase
MRICIFGGSGMLGHQLWRSFHKEHEVWVTLRRSSKEYAQWGLFEEKRTVYPINILEENELLEIFKRAKPELIINCIGVIKQAEESKDTLKSLEINSVFPHRLAQTAGRFGIRVLHVSTDCVFNGRKGNYSEKDPSDAEDVYGRTKFLGELDYENALTLRSSIIGHELETKNGLIEWFLSQNGKTIKGFTNAVYSGFTTIEFARIIAWILESGKNIRGVWQVASAPISKFELLNIAKVKYSWGGGIIPEDRFHCNRSLNGERFHVFSGYSAPTWESMLGELAADRDFYLKGNFKK